ncbi:MAG: hypothetical protein HQL19_07110 [Candidatus Omnitrophica bacterium]|nr:hypothetical protein [Candidatus Omnitrophota bacterium]
MKYVVKFLLLLLLPSAVFAASEPVSAPLPAAALTATKSFNAHAEYLKYFEEVYAQMDSHYYTDVKRSDYDRFIKAFDEKIYPSLLLEGKSNDYVRWRSAAYLVDFLKQPDDIFSRFLPPKPAEKFAQEVYGQKIDLGIEGHKEAAGFVVDFIEPRSDAYDKGLREADLIVRLDADDVTVLDESRIKEKLVPLAGAEVLIDYIDSLERKPHAIKVISREYFKQTVFLKSTGVKDIYCVDIQKFNQSTHEDFGRFIAMLEAKSPKGLVLDLRGNPGGPPLAALAISAFFLPNGETFAYFEGKNKPRSSLAIPTLPPQFHVDWPIVILVNNMTGSASELFSGIMQDRKRALVFGTSRTAGQVLLKSIFDMSDKSTIALMVARGHFPDGRPFSLDGVAPNELMPLEKNDEMVTLAAKYLFVKPQEKP